MGVRFVIEDGGRGEEAKSDSAQVLVYVCVYVYVYVLHVYVCVLHVCLYECVCGYLAQEVRNFVAVLFNGKFWKSNLVHFSISSIDR